MKIFLAFFVAMGSIVTLGDAYCFTELRKPGWPPNGCLKNGKLYPLGYIGKTKDCNKCNCDQDGMRCCSYVINTPHFNGEKCKVIFNRKRCEYDVVEKDDPSKECSLAVRVG